MQQVAGQALNAYQADTISALVAAVQRVNVLARQAEREGWALNFGLGEHDTDNPVRLSLAREV